MTQKYQINGISCGGCVSRVKKTLEEHPNIEKVEIFLAPKGATLITMKEALSVDELQNQLNALSGYTITEMEQFKSKNYALLRWKFWRNAPNMVGYMGRFTCLDIFHSSRYPISKSKKRQSTGYS